MDAVQVNFTKQANDEGHAFEKIMLSARGGEKQRMNVLQLSFLFDGQVQQRIKEHPEIVRFKSHTQLLEDQVAKYHKHRGVRDSRKRQLDASEVRSMINLSTGVCGNTKDRMRLHLNKRQWHESAFNSQLIKSPKWVMGFCFADSQADPRVKARLTVSEASQDLFMESYLGNFDRAAKRAKKSHL